MKNKMTFIILTVMILAVIISRVLSNKFGVNGRLIVGTCGVLITIIGIIPMAIKKNYLVVIMVMILLSPLVTCIIGIYFNNLYLTGGSLVVLIVMMILLIKFMPYFIKNK